MDSETYYVYRPDWDEEFLVYQEDDHWYWSSLNLQSGNTDHGVMGAAGNDLTTPNTAREWLRVNRAYIHPNYSTISFNICAECDKPVAYDYLCPECRDE
jgi:hypothetical protein